MEMTDEEQREYANRVKDWRRRHHLSTARMALAAGLANHTVWAIEKLIYKPYPQTMAKIAKLMEKYEKEAAREVESLDGLS